MHHSAATYHFLTIYRRKRRAKIMAPLFFMFLIGVLALFIMMGFFWSGPIVLGTEMNTDGLIEYMCLGRDCESLQPFVWMDK